MKLLTTLAVVTITTLAYAQDSSAIKPSEVGYNLGGLIGLLVGLYALFKVFFGKKK